MITKRSTDKEKIFKITNGLTNDFREDVLKGLTSHPKYIPSKYLYDETGDKLFSTIMGLPEYYPTSCEYEILNIYKKEIISLFIQGNEKFDLIELGAGDGYKTKVLLGEIHNMNLPVTYKPVDISSDVLELLSDDLEKLFPQLNVVPVWSDYTNALREISTPGNKKVIMIMGANIGNSSPTESFIFLREIKNHMNPGDKVLIGFDLKKHPREIINAYDDKSGITRAFNLNLLNRINKELSANFDLSQFGHYPTYNPVTGAVESFLISLKNQTVHLGKLNITIYFKAWETIHTELSQKYTMEEIKEMSRKAGLNLLKEFYDHKGYYTDCLFERL